MKKTDYIVLSIVLLSSFVNASTIPVFSIADNILFENEKLILGTNNSLYNKIIVIVNDSQRHEIYNQLIDVFDGKTAINRTFPVGYYKLSALNPNSSKKDTIFYGYFIVVPIQSKQPDSSSHFGIHIETDSAGLFKAKRSGAGWIRLHGHGGEPLKWSIICKEKNNCNWPDDEIERIYKSGLNILANVEMTPIWASSKPEAVSYPWKSIYFGPYAYIPKNISDWEDFLKNAFTRYKDKIKNWEIWNEPDIQFLVSDKSKVQDYNKLLYSANNTRIKVDKTLKIVAPAIAYYITEDKYINSNIFPEAEIKNYRDPDFYKNFVDTVNNNEFDIISIHHYSNINLSKNVLSIGKQVNLKEKINKIKEDLGKNKEVWVTEYNVISSGKYSSQSDSVAANLLIKEHCEYLAAGVSKIFVFNAFNYDIKQKFNNYFSKDGPTRLFLAYAIMTNKINNSKLKSIDYSNPSISKYTFINQENDEEIVVICSEKEKNIFNFSESGVITDYLGQDRAVLSGEKLELNNNQVIYFAKTNKN